MANRKTRRSQKNKGKTTTNINLEEAPLTNGLKITLIVVGIFIVFYILTTFITKELNRGLDEDSEPVFIQYEEILAMETFSMNYQDYYVMFYDFKDELSFIYTNIVDSFNDRYPDNKIYMVDLNKGINAYYMAEESNSKVNKLEDLKLTGPTLIRIKDRKNTLYVEGAIEIKDALK